MVLDLNDDISDDALLEAATSQQGTLRQLHWLSEKADKNKVAFFNVVEEVARAVPQLSIFVVDVAASVAEGTRLLRNEAPFEALRVRCLEVDQPTEDGEATAADVLSLVAALRGHASLRELSLRDVSLRSAAVLDTLAAAVVAGRLSRLVLCNCGLSPASVPALVHILRGGALTVLDIVNNGALLFDVPAAVQLADALVAHRSLQVFELYSAQLWSDPVATAAIIGALTRHPSLQSLFLCSDTPANRAAAGAALSALVAANSPSLHHLSLSHLHLGDDGLRHVLAALPCNRHLQMLDLEGAGMSDEFARDVLLPAVRASASLRTLLASKWWGGDEDGVAPPAVLEAEALVAARGGASS